MDRGVDGQYRLPLPQSQPRRKSKENGPQPVFSPPHGFDSILYRQCLLRGEADGLWQVDSGCQRPWFIIDRQQDRLPVAIGDDQLGRIARANAEDIGNRSFHLDPARRRANQEIDQGQHREQYIQHQSDIGEIPVQTSEKQQRSEGKGEYDK